MDEENLLLKISRQKHRRIFSATIAFIANILSAGTVYWRYEADENRYEGLWFDCQHNECSPKNDLPDWLLCCKVFTVLSCVLKFTCALVFVLSTCCTDQVEILQRKNGFLVAAGSLFQIFSLTVYLVNTIHHNNGLDSLQSSFYIGWVAIFMDILILLDIYKCSRVSQFD